MELLTVGNGAVQSDTTDCTSFLLTTRLGLVVLDCGPGTVGRLISNGIDMARIDTIFISHQHGDHIAEYAYLLFMINRALKHSGIYKMVNVLTLPSVHTILEYLAASQYPPPAIANVTIRRIDASEARRFDLDLDFGSVSTVPVSHSVPTIGIRIQEGHASVAYSADTELSNDFITLAAGVDLLMHESLCHQEMADVARIGKHSTAWDAGTAALRAGANSLVLFHPLPEAMGHRSEIVGEAFEAFSGPVTLPRSGERITL